MVSPGCPVVGFGRPYFTTEASEVYRLTVNANTRLPVLIVAFPTDTLVFGAVIYISIFCSVPAILRRAGRAKIGLSIVQTVSIDMVHEQIVGYSEYLTMHEYLTLSAIFDFD